MGRLRICVAGLGNPGTRYQGTRHNIGFDWVQRAAEAFISGSVDWKEKYHSHWAMTALTLGDQDFELHFLMPQTFMNESGKALTDWTSKNQGESKILVVYDDMDLPLGGIRYRSSGSDGGHRGIRSVIERLGTQNVPRLRLGIGRPLVDGVREETLDHVLEKFNPDEKKIVQKVVSDAGEQLKLWLTQNDEQAMNKINSKKFTA